MCTVQKLVFLGVLSLFLSGSLVAQNLLFAEQVDSRPFSLPWRGWISDPVTGEQLHLPQNPLPVKPLTPQSQQELAPFQGILQIPLPEPSFLSEEQVFLETPGLERELALVVHAYIPLKEWQKLITEVTLLEQKQPVPAVFDRMEFYLAQAYGYLGHFREAVLAIASAQSINSQLRQRWLTALLSHLS